jgi:hypothetical protein
VQNRLFESDFDKIIKQVELEKEGNWQASELYNEEEI